VNTLLQHHKQTADDVTQTGSNADVLLRSDEKVKVVRAIVHQLVSYRPHLLQLFNY